MAYTNANWTCVSASLSQGQETVDVYGVGNTVLNAPNLFMYGSPNDTAATILAANYFLAEYVSLSVGDWIMGFGTDTSFVAQVTAVSSTSVTVESTGMLSSVGTANILNNAVTYAKIQQTSQGDVLIGNPTGSAADVEEITLGNGLSFTGTTIQVNPSLDNYISVAITLAEFLAMYATPFQVIAAPGAGKMILVDRCDINFVYGSAALAGGGAVGLQYGSTDHLGGVQASATEAATDFTSASANTMFHFGAGLGTGAPTASTINTALYISNSTAAFTGGTGGSFVANIWYKIVSAS